MKKILSQSPFFLIFFGILGYSIYSSNFDKKMKKLMLNVENSLKKRLLSGNMKKKNTKNIVKDFIKYLILVKKESGKN